MPPLPRATAASTDSIVARSVLTRSVRCCALYVGLHLVTSASARASSAAGGWRAALGSFRQSWRTEVRRSKAKRTCEWS
eukprot:6604701-Prymnesium_polylepis.1